MVTIPWNTCIQNLQGQLRKEEGGKSLALARVLPWWCTEFGKTILMQSASTILQLVVASTCSVWFPALHPLQTQNIIYSTYMQHVTLYYNVTCCMYVDPRKYMNIFLTAWLLIMTGRLVLCTLWAQALACFLKVGRSSWLFLEDWRAFSHRVGFVHPRKICLDFTLTPKCAISFKTSAEINPYFLNLSSG